MMYNILVIAALICAVLLILIVLIQDSKGGASAALGGSGATQMMGARRANDFLEKATWGFAITFMVLCLSSTFVKATDTEAKKSANAKAAQQEQVEAISPLEDAELPTKGQ